MSSFSLWPGDDAAGAQEWSIEMTSPEHLSRVGWRPHTLKAGDKVTLLIHPMRDATKGGQYLSGIGPNGPLYGTAAPDSLSTTGGKMMAAVNRCAALLLCAVIGSVAAVAKPPPAASTEGRAPLPDWFGQWEIVGSTPSATGGMNQSLQESVAQMQKWGPPPYKPEARAQFDQVVSLVQQGNAAALAGVPNPGLTHAVCTWGFPLIMVESPLMFEILPTARETVMVFSGREIRHIYTDGRAHPAEDELWPTYWGDSIGHWEGQTLVIDTIDINSPFGPSPSIIAFGGNANEFAMIALLSERVHFIERIRLIDRDHLENQMTIIDPALFAAPWHINRRYQRVNHIHRMVHEDCQGEDRNPIVNGQYTLTPPPNQPLLPPSPPPSSAPH